MVFGYSFLRPQSTVLAVSSGLPDKRGVNGFRNRKWVTLDGDIGKDKGAEEESLKEPYISGSPRAAASGSRFQGSTFSVQRSAFRVSCSVFRVSRFAFACSLSYPLNARRDNKTIKIQLPFQLNTEETAPRMKMKIENGLLRTSNR